MRTIWLIGFLVALWSGVGAQSLVLTNGDVNGDNQIDDADLLTVLFSIGRTCEPECPEDLNGDALVDDADLLIVQFNIGQVGAPAFAGSVQTPSGAFGRRLHLQLGDWPDGFFARLYSSFLARQGYASAGLPRGWTHNYDVWLEGDLNRVTLHYPNGAVETLTVRQVGTTWLLEAPAGAPYKGVGSVNQQGNYWNRVRLYFVDGSAWEFEPAGANRYRLSHIYERGAAYIPIDQPPPATGLFLRLEYDGAGRLTTLRSGRGTALLTLSYSGNYLQSVTARDHAGAPYATITYTVQDVQGVPCLVRVSQVNTTSAYLWEYGYEVRLGVPYLNLIRTPHPSGSGTAQSQVVYGSNGAVLMVIDGNQNLRTYTYQGAQTQVEVYEATGSKNLGWFQKIGAQNVNGGIQDAQGAQSSLSYENTYRPVQYTNRNGQTFTIMRDRFGNITSIISPRGIRLNFQYEYPENYPVEPIISLTVERVGEDGSSITPTRYEFYQATNPSQGMVKGLLGRMLSPRPGTVNSNEQVETRFYYTPLGNVALIDQPSWSFDPNRRLTTLLFYATDPWVPGSSFPERKGQPVAIAVYDRALNLSDYAQIAGGNTVLRDNALIFFERYRYDNRGNLIEVYDAEGNVTQYAYNSADQLVSVTYPADSNSVQARNLLVYAYVGGPLKQLEVWNALNNSRFRTYGFATGSEGEIKDFSTSNTSKAQFSFDGLYRIKKLTGGRNSTTGQRHDTVYGFEALRGFPQSTRYPNGDTYTCTAFDNEGNPLELRDAANGLQRFRRSPIDSRLERVEYNDGGITGNIVIEYDPFNRVNKLIRFPDDPTRRIVVEYEYDDTDRVLVARTTYPNLPPQEVRYTISSVSISPVFSPFEAKELTRRYKFDGG